MTAIMSANAVGARTWAVDYRMPPDHPFPTPLDDCLTAYRLLLEERSPEQIIVGGASAGGNLAAALILRARDLGLPLPAAALFNTGAFDLTGSGDSWQTNNGLDNVLDGSASPAIEIYAGGHDLRDPYLSPLFGDLAGFPPTILLTGTRDMLLSDNVRMHRALPRRGRRRRAPRVGGRGPRRLPGHGARRRRPVRRATALRRGSLDHRRASRHTALITRRARGAVRTGSPRPRRASVRDSSPTAGSGARHRPRASDRGGWTSSRGAPCSARVPGR